jgi:hypothetical protein
VVGLAQRPAYSRKRPVGNDADGNVYPSLDTYGSASGDHGATWSTSVRMSDVTTNPNYEQFSDRTVPFAGADVHQCRTHGAAGFTSDACPRDGGLDQNIYGDVTP